MAEFETAEHHGHPAFDICRQKDQGAVLDDHLQVGIEELEHKVEIGLGGEHVQKLRRDDALRWPGDAVYGAPTSMTFGWCSSRRYLTSRTADMSRPSLNWPTLIFLIAIFRPVASSRPALACQH
jgi:hypothetical protein